MRRQCFGCLGLLLAVACGGTGGDRDLAPDVRDVPGTDEAAGEGVGSDLSRDEADPDSPVDADLPIPTVCNVRDFGAVGDGQTLDTAALQAAIDACMGRDGIVVVPAGTYWTGTLWLKSRMTLRLEEGARLLGTTEREDWTGPGLLSADQVEDLVIEGPGTVDGNGPYWWAQILLDDGWRPDRLVWIRDGVRVTVRNLFLTQSPKWTLHFLRCDQVLAEGIRIRNTVGDRISSPNTDGIDIDACRDVEIRHCDIETGDDCIVVKNGTPGYRRASYNILVHHCTCAAWANGFKIGTRPGADVHHVTFRDSVVQATVDSLPGTRVMGGVTLVSDDGATVSDILAENLHMKAVHAPFFLRVQQRDLSDEEGRFTEAGRLDRVTLRNLRVDDCTLPGMIFGIPGYPVEGVRLEDVSITSSVGGTPEDREIRPDERNFEYPDAVYFGTQPAYGLYARHVRGPLVLAGEVRFASLAPSEARAAVVLEDVAEKDLSGLVPGTEVVDRDAR